MTKLSWSKLIYVYLIYINHQFPEINDHVIESILKRCGRYLIDIDFVKCNYEHFQCEKIDYPGLLTLVAKYCPNVKSINYRNVSIEGLEELLEHCKNIKELRILGNLNFEFDKVLGNLFLNSNRLRVLELSSFRGSDNCLLNLPLEKITQSKFEPSWIHRKNK